MKISINHLIFCASTSISNIRLVIRSKFNHYPNRHNDSQLPFTLYSSNGEKKRRELYQQPTGFVSSTGLSVFESSRRGKIQKCAWLLDPTHSVKHDSTSRTYLHSKSSNPWKHATLHDPVDWRTSVRYPCRKDGQLASRGFQQKKWRHTTLQAA